MRKTLISLGLIALAAMATSCNERTDKSEGNVILTITGFDGLPFQVSVNGATAVQVEEFELSNFPKDPAGVTSNLMDIELRSFEVVFTRADRGTRRPPTHVGGIFGAVPVGGTDTIDNLPILILEQLDTVPLSDLQFINGGFDKETGETTIRINCNVTFFGRTLAGDNVKSNTASFVVEFVP